jgi:tetratricopeptide (TPR) repeat protein
MNKMNISPEVKLELLTSRRLDRDDLFVELAKSYNQNGEHKRAIETLLGRKFVSCEGGEHAIADQYIFAHLSLGIEAFNMEDYAKALEYFIAGQTLPESLGSGIWNHCKLIPLKYREALCLDKLGREEEAEAIYRYIADTEIEYFSNMHLPELPYYRALSYDRLGEGLKARAMITKYRRVWAKMEGVKDNGFFATTPFFISFVDDPESLRRSKFLYLTALCDRYEGKNAKADEKMSESYALNNDNLFAKIM